MSTGEIKTKLHALIDAADDNQLQRFYDMLSQDESFVDLSPDEVLLAKERMHKYKSGAYTALSYDEVKQRLAAYKSR